MTTAEVQFYLRHRRQISEWAKLEGRLVDTMRDAVQQGGADKAVSLLMGESGEADVDFYVRNRSLITEWDRQQTSAGQALHASLLDAIRRVELVPSEGRRGWTSVMIRSAEVEELADGRNAAVELAWARQDLMSTRRGYAFPRLALNLPTRDWGSEARARIAKATRPTAHQLGLKKRDDSWVHWGMLEEISESQDLDTYADACVARLLDAAAILYPVLLQTLSTEPDH